MLIIIKEAEYKKLREAVEDLTNDTVEDAREHIMQVMENGEHKLSTIMEIIREEVDMLLEVIPSESIKRSVLVGAKLPQILETYLFNFSLFYAKTINQ